MAHAWVPAQSAPMFVNVTPDVEQAALLPEGAAVRDAAFLERQGNLLDDIERQAAG